MVAAELFLFFLFSTVPEYIDNHVCDKNSIWTSQFDIPDIRYVYKDNRYVYKDKIYVYKYNVI